MMDVAGEMKFGELLHRYEFQNIVGPFCQVRRNTHSVIDKIKEYINLNGIEFHV
jgi:hypothetical protein